MIKLSKLDEPPILAKNAIKWTKVLLDTVAAGKIPTETERPRYRHPQIKDTLVRETHGKCAYCESKLRHIHHGDVEHIMPKSLDLGKIVQWDNLTLACEKCNQKQ